MNEKFPLGSKVMLKKSSEHYYQAPGLIGTVIETRIIYLGWVRVEWEEPIRMEQLYTKPFDSYRIDDLVPATKLGKLLAGLEHE